MSSEFWPGLDLEYPNKDGEDGLGVYVACVRVLINTADGKDWCGSRGPSQSGIDRRPSSYLRKEVERWTEDRKIGGLLTVPGSRGAKRVDKCPSRPKRNGDLNIHSLHARGPYVLTLCLMASAKLAAYTRIMPAVYLILHLTIPEKERPFCHERLGTALI